jgi:hypothetical protein
MFIRRACLQAVGPFDEAAFGRGYGEENDFSRRAAAAGWRNVLAADVFVYHRGAVSFGAGRFELMKQAEAALLARHPDYHRHVGAFVAADPPAPMRAAVDRARASVGAAEALQVLGERERERAALLAELRAARLAAQRAANAVPAIPAQAPRSMLRLARDWLDEGSVRLALSTRWGPRRRAVLRALLSRLSAWMSRWDR